MSQTWNTAGTYLWLCPAGVTNVHAECWGGGGGGGGVSTTGVVRKGGGGGGGAYAEKTNLLVTPGNLYTIVIPPAAGGGAANSTSAAAGTNGATVGFTNEFNVSIYANGGAGGAANSATSTAAGGAATAGADVSWPGGNGAPVGSNSGGGGSGASDLAPGNSNFAQAGTNAPAGSDALHTGGSGGGGGGPGSAGSSGTTPGGGGGGSRTYGYASFNAGGNGGVGKIILTWIAGTNTATIGMPNYSSVSDASTPNYNLTALGTQDWQLFGDANGVFTVQPNVQKLYGSSISAGVAVGDSPADGEQSSSRSAQTYSWTDGEPTSAGTNVDAENNGFVYTNLNPVAFYENSETITFVPGDTNAHIVHLLGYVAGDNNGLSLQFSNSLAGAVGTVFTTNPPPGDFDYSLPFQANDPNAALTVVWTFSQTNLTGSQTYVGIQAATLSGTTPSAPPPRLVNWRVIPDDTNFPTADVLVAGVVWGDTNWGVAVPSNPAKQDCTKYVQGAMSWLSGQGGGTVYLPPGHYCFSNSLSMPDNITLRGRWVQPVAGQPLTNGTILDIYADAGNTNATYFVTSYNARLPCGLRDLTFWYPNQNPTNWVYYPWTISNPNTWLRTVENVTLVNSYLGCSSHHSANVAWRGIYGTTLLTGVEEDNGSAVPRFEEMHLAPDYWVWSGLAGAPANTAVLTSQTLTNTSCVGMLITGAAGTYFLNSTFSGYCYGFRIQNLNGQFFGVVVTNCTEALRIEYSVALNLVNCTFNGTTYGYHRTGGQGPDFYGCTLSGGTYSVYEEPATPFHDLHLMNCTLSGAVNVGRASSPFYMIGSHFTSGTPTNVILNGVGTAQIVSAPGANCGPANVQLNGTPSTYMCTTNGFVPLPPSTFPLTYGKVRKPAKEMLFDVTSTNFSIYGAYGDAIHDDTAAIQATINAAQTNGGGIVFFPAGQYIITSPLTVSNGVELRGMDGTGRHAEERPGSMLSFRPPGVATNGPAFLTLGDGCGAYGMNFHCPFQNFKSGTFVPYPYAIECRGVSNYLIGCASGNMSQSLDLNGARSALVDYCKFGGYTNILRVRGGAADCRYQNSHSQPWGGISGAKGGVGGPDGTFTTYYTGDIFIAQDCTNLAILSSYSHIAHNLFTVDGNASVSVLLINGEQMQNGYVCKSGNGSLYLLESGCNLNSAGDASGAYAFWLQTNYTGTVLDVTFPVNISFANRGVWMENSQAKWSGYDVNFGDAPIWALKAAGSVTLVGSYLSQCTQDVPGNGGSLVAIESTLAAMPYVSQAGTVNFSTNCLSTGNSFIGVNLADVPYDPNGMTLNTNNLAPGWTEGNAWGTFPPNPPGDQLGWQLASGSNFSFHVTSPYFTNGIRPNVTISVAVLGGIPTNGSVTLSYDSTNGMKTINGTSATVSDARFSGVNGVDILLTANNANPLLAYATVAASSNLGVAPQLSNTPLPPVAAFTCAPTNGIRPLAVTFTDASSGTITNLQWSFGDSQTTNTPAGAVVVHNYGTAGTYSVSLKATGPGGSSYIAQTGRVTVLVPKPPQITSIQPMGTSALVLQGTGGPTNGGYYYWLRSSTNLALPLTNWSIVATNSFDAYGNYSNQIPLTPGMPQQFYRLQMP